MKFSTRGRYAIRILLDIAMHQEKGYVAMKDIARRQQISKKYSDQIGIGSLTAKRQSRGFKGLWGLYFFVKKINFTIA